MTIWSDAGVVLITRYVDGLDYQGVRSRRPCASVLRRFHRFLEQQSTGSLSTHSITCWLGHEAAASPRSMVIRRAQIVDTFLDWLVDAGHLASNPFAELRHACRPRGTRSIVPALLAADPERALAALHPFPPYASRFGPTLRDHVTRMRALGYRCSEDRFLRFDRFVQQRAASDEPLDAVISAYVRNARSPAMQMDRLKVGRVFTRALQRHDPMVPDPPEYDPLVKRAMLRSRCQPHIYSPEEIATLLRTARTMPSPHAPLRPLTLYTMVVLAYCAGLRMGELTRLQVGDVHLELGALEIQQSKFFKSRRLPLRRTVVAALAAYLEARRRSGRPTGPDASLFGYAFQSGEALLRRVIHTAGLKPEHGRGGARVHDLRHTFVVHRMLEWYRQGINPQSRLPYLATYLGHRDIHSTLVYLTITQDLLGLAGERFRTLGADLLSGPPGESHGLDAFPAAPATGVLSSVARGPARRLRPHRACLPR